jgi:hypothetical protein
MGFGNVGLLFSPKKSKKFNEQEDSSETINDSTELRYQVGKEDYSRTAVDSLEAQEAVYIASLTKLTNRLVFVQHNLKYGNQSREMIIALHSFTLLPKVNDIFEKNDLCPKRDGGMKKKAGVKELGGIRAAHVTIRIRCVQDYVWELHESLLGPS